MLLLLVIVLCCIMKVTNVPWTFATSPIKMKRNSMATERSGGST